MQEKNQVSMYLSKSIALRLENVKYRIVTIQFKWLKTEKNYIISRCFYGTSEGQLYNQRICLPEIVLASLAVSWVHWWGPVGDTSLRAVWASGIKGSVSIEEEIKLGTIHILCEHFLKTFLTHPVLSVGNLPFSRPTQSFNWRNIWVVP